jgi:hypothetical protein
MISNYRITSSPFSTLQEDPKRVASSVLERKVVRIISRLTVVLSLFWKSPAMQASLADPVRISI